MKSPASFSPLLVTYSPLNPNVFLSTPFSNTSSLRFSLNLSEQSHTHTKQQKNYAFPVNNHYSL